MSTARFGRKETSRIACRHRSARRYRHNSRASLSRIASSCAPAREDVLAVVATTLRNPLNFILLSRRQFLAESTELERRQRLLKTSKPSSAARRAWSA